MVIKVISSIVIFFLLPSYFVWAWEYFYSDLENAILKSLSYSGIFISFMYIPIIVCFVYFIIIEKKHIE
ncbi:hypothetical protein RC92_19490 [Pectobacterium brasiliense]|nr:hypothetical protein RC92_19490 [Pectobacterium brasiliense]